MKDSLNCLLTYISAQGMNLPTDWTQFQELLEDIGLEVKRVEHDADEQDIVFTLELLANRGDHHCYLGLAREIHLRTSWPLLRPPSLILDVSEAAPLAQVTSEKCLAYTLSAYVIEEVAHHELAPQFKKMIELSGTNLIAPAIDVTNLVNIEIGQPMHVFDGHKIKGQVQVRDALAGETALLLGSSEPVALPKGALVIADDEKILAVAGVVGCETSKPTATSRCLYLESGTFDPVSVRQTAKALGIQSLASARYERGADPDLAVAGVYRAHRLLTDLGWTTQGLGICKAYSTPLPEITTSTLAINQFFATQFETHYLVDIFKRVGCLEVKVEQDGRLNITVPPHRIWDLKLEADLFEEVAKAVGYNQLPSLLPASASGSRPHVFDNRQACVESLLVAEGFYEIFTDSFYSDQDVALLTSGAADHALAHHVRINNSETKAYSLLKNNNLIQALSAVETNVRVKNEQIQMFERNTRFVPNSEAANGLCDELAVIWGLMVGHSILPSWQKHERVFDFFYCKGLIEKMSTRLSLHMDFVLPDQADAQLHPYVSSFHPKRFAVLRVALDSAQSSWQVCGIFGEIHPALVKTFGLKAVRPYFFEFEQSVLHLQPLNSRYLVPDNVLPVKRDLCFGLYQQQPAGYIAQWILQFSQWLDDVTITDLFETKDQGENMRAVTFSLMLNPRKANKDVFSGAEITTEVERIAAAVEAHFGSNSVRRR